MRQNARQDAYPKTKKTLQIGNVKIAITNEPGDIFPDGRVFRHHYGFISGPYGKKAGDIYIAPDYELPEAGYPPLHRIEQAEGGNAWFLGYPNPYAVEADYTYNMGIAQARPCAECTWAELDPTSLDADDEEEEADGDDYVMIPRSRLAELGIMEGSPLWDALVGEEYEEDEDEDEGEVLDLDELL